MGVNSEGIFPDARIFICLLFKLSLISNPNRSSNLYSAQSISKNIEKILWRYLFGLVYAQSYDGSYRPLVWSNRSHLIFFSSKFAKGTESCDRQSSEAQPSQNVSAVLLLVGFNYLNCIV